MTCSPPLSHRRPPLTCCPVARPKELTLMTPRLQMHTCIPAYMHACMHSNLHECIHAYVHTCIHACTHTCIRAYMHTCMPACMHACVRACIDREIDRYCVCRYIDVDLDVEMHCVGTDNIDKYMDRGTATRHSHSFCTPRQRVWGRWETGSETGYETLWCVAAPLSAKTLNPYLAHG